MTLDCPCGMNLKAAGARPGRVGKCPRCGTLLRVPDAPALSEPEPPAEADEAPGFEPDSSPSTFHRRRERAAQVRRPGRDPWAGIASDHGPVRPPKGGDTTWTMSLAYPLWSWSSVALLGFLPPALVVGSSPIPFAVGLVVGGSPAQPGGMFLLVPGFVIGFFLWGYILAFLGEVLTSSAFGDALPPRTPGLDAEVVRTLSRWFWSLLAGVAVGFVPAVAYWIWCGEVDWADRLMFVNLIALGAAYAQMALLAALVHDDPLAANPITVGRAILRAGWDYAGVSLLGGLFVVGATFGMVGVTRVGHPTASLALLWLFYLVFLYGAMVVLRRLGLFCHRNRVLLAWFADRPRMGL